jgi:hypothetical protein
VKKKKEIPIVYLEGSAHGPDGGAGKGRTLGLGQEGQFAFFNGCQAFYLKHSRSCQTEEKTVPCSIQMRMRILMRIQGLMTKNWNQFTAEIFFISINDIQATGEVFIPQKRTSMCREGFCYCPAIISHRPRSQNILKERALNPD